MGAQECPRCHLISDPDASACDCGYEFASGALGAQRAACGLSRTDREAVAETADRYRTLLGIVLLQAMLGGGSRAVAHLAKASGGPEAVFVVSIVSILLLVGVGVVAAAHAYGAAKGMGLRSPGVWAAAILFGGILAVLVMNGRAREWSARHDLRFGLLGPNRNDIDRFAGAQESRGRTTRG